MLKPKEKEEIDEKINLLSEKTGRIVPYFVHSILEEYTVRESKENKIDLDQLDFDIETAAELCRDGKSWEQIARHLDADVEPERVRKSIDRYIEVNYR